MSPLSFRRKPEFNKKAQAAAELAVFGAILIFILGTIVRSAVGNSYTQNQNFKAMRMAMLASWQGSEAAQGLGAVPNTSHNSASVLFVEDRLSPDIGKYGDLDRNPYIAQGSGTFSYEMLYPTDVSDLASPANYPIMDIYINGKHFPFTTATYATTLISPPACAIGGPYGTPPVSSTQCLQNQCLRNQREWVGGVVTASQFESIIPIPLSATAEATLISNANSIVSELVSLGLITSVPGSVPAQYRVNSTDTSAVPLTFGGITLTIAQMSQVQSVLQANQHAYKLFYAMAANGQGGGGASQSGGSSGSSTTPFSVTPSTCAAHPCKDKELSSDASLAGHGNQGAQSGDLMFDLNRLGVYDSTNPSFITSSSGLRPYVAWEWMATAGTTPALIGLDTSSQQYPSYDIDGRLKPVTIYTLSQDPTTGYPTVGYEDFQGGDIDSTWDSNSCGPKPGLQSNSQIFTFTQNGTYLQIKEGQMYNPETGQWVRSVNKKDSIDLIQRTIQLSNNTGRFCPKSVTGAVAGSGNVVGTNDPNPVEVCVDGTSCNCFMGSAVNPACGNTIAETCYDNSDNMIYVRSRLEDRRGNAWITNASGQLKVQ